ncbi:MAG: cyclase family protein [Actinocatenispora sp.]
MITRRQVATTGAAAALGGLVGGASASAASAGPAMPEGFRFDQVRLVNLSHVNDPATTNVFPGDPPFTLEVIDTIPEDGFYLQYMREGEHTGTHYGAPGHFNAGQPLADQLDPGDFFRPAVKIDVREQSRHDANYAVTIEDVRRHERRYGRIPDESFVVIWTGWDAKWGTPAYPNQSPDGVIHQPGFAVDTVRWLIDTGRLGRRGGTGTDTFSPDVGTDETFTVSKLVYRRHRLSLEILGNLAQLPPAGAWLLAGGPINHRGAGAPSTIFGFIPEHGR